MQEKSDIQLLRDFSRNGTDAAFGEIVVRYTDLVCTSLPVQSQSAASDVSATHRSLLQPGS
jgi:hypothetical protein